MRARAPRAASSQALLLLLPAVAAATGALSCSGGDALGPPDSYLVFAPEHDGEGRARTSPSGLPLCAAVPLNDPRAVPYHKLFALGFPSEILRTGYLAKQLIRDVEWKAKRFSPAARAAAAQPTVLVLEREPAAAPGAGLATKGFLGGAKEHAGVPWLGVTDDPERDAALAQTLAARLARPIALAVATGGGAGAPGQAPPGQALRGHVLIDGYVSAMEVIAREWRVGEGPQGAIAPDAGTEAQRQIFAAVRQNQFVLDEASGQPRPAAEMLADPGVAATIIYRMAQAKGIGHRIGPADIYAPFVADRVPEGVSPAAVLGPFRNFQAKLLSVWGRAVLAGTPPHDIAELISAYADALPGERAEVIRMFVVTTFGATVRPGGVTLKKGAAADALPELTALAAEVAAGRRSIRGALALNTGK